MPRLGLRLTPHGRLSVEDQDDGPDIDAAASIRLIDAFARGTGYGLMWLGAAAGAWLRFPVGRVALSARGRRGSGGAPKAAECTGANCCGALIPGVDRTDYG